MVFNRLVFRVHAIQRMYQRTITETEVRHAIVTGETVEDYPDDKPYPSRLVLGWNGPRPIHVVVADNLTHFDVLRIIKTWKFPSRVLIVLNGLNGAQRLNGLNDWNGYL